MLNVQCIGKQDLDFEHSIGRRFNVRLTSGRISVLGCMWIDVGFQRLVIRNDLYDNALERVHIRAVNGLLCETAVQLLACYAWKSRSGSS